MPENKPAANLRRSLKKIHRHCLRYSSGVTFLLTPLSFSPSPRRPTQLFQVHLQGVREHHPQNEINGYKEASHYEDIPEDTPKTFSLGPVPIFFRRIAVRELGPYWYWLGPLHGCHRPSPGDAG